MKKIVSKKVQFCDNCGEEAYCDTCLNCGAEHCFKCRDTCGVEYPHAAHFKGSFDGYYCNRCDAKLRKTRTSPLFNAYQKIQVLRQKEKNFYDAFNIAADAVEQTIKILRKEAIS